MTRQHLLAIAAIVAVTLSPMTAMAETTAQVMVGPLAGPNASFTFSKASAGKSSELTITTRLVGVPGAQLTIGIDRQKPLVSRLLTTDDCAFDNDGSQCRLTIRETHEYRRFVAAFKRGRAVHVQVQNAGVMRMDVKASLIGFSRTYGR